MQRSAQTGSRSAPQRQTNLPQRPDQRGAASGIPPGQRGHLLSEGSLRAGSRVAEEPANAQVDHHGAATQGFIRDPPAVVAVNAAGAPPAGWAGGRSRPPVGFDMNQTVEHQQALNP
jgi:hypothetical protein